MNNQSTAPTFKIKPEPVSLLHHTHSNADGKVVTYYAYQLITNPQQFPLNIFDRPSAVQSHVYAAAWLEIVKRNTG